MMCVSLRLKSLGLVAAHDRQDECGHEGNKCDGEEDQRNLAHEGGRHCPNPLHHEHGNSGKQTEQGKNRAACTEPADGSGIGKGRGRPVCGTARVLYGFVTHEFNGISSHTAVNERSPRFSGLRLKFTAYAKLGGAAALFAHARCFNRGMSEQVIELLPETTPAADAPAESAVPSAAPESTDEGSAVPAETQPSVNAEETVAADAPAEESTSEEAEQNEDSTPDPFTPLDEEVGTPSLGVPHKLRRTSKVDEILAAAKDVALQGVQEIAPAHAIGLVHHVRAEEERLSTHLFECTLPGYRGWFWFATLSRAPRSRVATICEVGLLPGDDALIAPDWVPWADRVRPEDLQENAAQENAESAEAAEAEESAEPGEPVENNSVENETAQNESAENKSAVEEIAEAESAE
mgnify:CR=1 FL=1